MIGENRMSSIPRRVSAALLTAAFAIALPATSSAQDSITLNVRDASLSDVLLLIARQGNINIVPDGGLPTTRIAALNLTGLTPRIALEKAYALREIPADGYTRIVAINGSGTSLDGTAETARFEVPGGNAAAIVKPCSRFSPASLSLRHRAGGRSSRAARPIKLRGRAPSLRRSPMWRLVRICRSPSSSACRIQRPRNCSRTSPRGLTDPPVTAIAEDSHNRLVVRGPVDAVYRLRVAVASMDTPVAKVTFEVQVLDIQPTNSSNIGVLWNVSVCWRPS